MRFYDRKHAQNEYKIAEGRIVRSHLPQRMKGLGRLTPAELAPLGKSIFCPKENSRGQTGNPAANYPTLTTVALVLRRLTPTWVSRETCSIMKTRFLNRWTPERQLEGHLKGKVSFDWIERKRGVSALEAQFEECCNGIQGTCTHNKHCNQIKEHLLILSKPSTCFLLVRACFQSSK